MSACDACDGHWQQQMSSKLKSNWHKSACKESNNKSPQRDKWSEREEKKLNKYPTNWQLALSHYRRWMEVNHSTWTMNNERNKVNLINCIRVYARARLQISISQHFGVTQKKKDTAIVVLLFIILFLCDAKLTALTKKTTKKKEKKNTTNKQTQKLKKKKNGQNSVVKYAVAGYWLLATDKTHYSVSNSIKITYGSLWVQLCNSFCC